VLGPLVKRFSGRLKLLPPKTGTSSGGSRGKGGGQGAKGGGGAAGGGKPPKKKKYAATTRKSRAARSAKSIDKDGGHSHGDHGSHTTKQQQEHRLKTGISPTGRTQVDKKGIPIKVKKASKFDTNEKHVEAKRKADRELERRRKAGTLKPKGKEDIEVDVKDAGISYKLDPATGKTVETKTDKAIFIYRYNPTTGKYEVATGYPN